MGSRLERLVFQSTLCLCLVVGCNPSPSTSRTDASVSAQGSDSGQRTADAALADASDSSAAAGGTGGHGRSGGSGGKTAIVGRGGSGGAPRDATEPAGAGGSSAAGTEAAGGAVAGGTAAVCRGRLLDSSTAGASGSAAGSGGAGEAPDVGQACDTMNALVCEGNAATARLRCDGAHWQLAACREDERCSTTQGAACQPLKPACEFSGQAICVGKAVYRCGLDLTSVDLVHACSDPMPNCIAGECTATNCQPRVLCNALRNPDFDSDVDAWEVVGNAPAPTWSNADSTQCAQSGSLKIGSQMTTVHQCAALQTGTLEYGLDIVLQHADSSMLVPTLELTMWSGQSCDGNQTGGVTSTYAGPLSGAVRQGPSIWAPYANFSSVDFKLTVPSGAQIDKAYLIVR